MSSGREELQAGLKARPFFSEAGWSEPETACKFGDVSWRPDFVNDSGVMCVLTGETIPPYLRKRLEAAFKEGKSVTCVADLDVLTDSLSIELLARVDAHVSYVGVDGEPQTPKRLLKVLGEEEVPVAPEVRSKVVHSGLASCESAESSNDKGRRLEELIHFMFSQVSDFRVLRCNYRTLTEELDCVVQIRCVTLQRCWSNLAAPHILIEGKNREQKTGQESVSKLQGIMHGKRQTCRIGFLVSLSGFTSNARNQVLRFATDEKIFVLLDSQNLKDWAEADNYDDALEAYVTSAILD